MIYDSTAPFGEGEGLYIQALASEVNDVETIKILHNRAFGSDSKSTFEDFTDDALRRIYIAKPTAFWMNDADVDSCEILRDYRVKINI